MTNIALTQLQRQIEAVRREAFAEGYAAAMQRVRDFASRPPDGFARIGTAAAPPAGVRPGRTGGTLAEKPRRAPRPPHGTNARLVAAVLQSIAPRAARPSEIRRLLLRDHGAALAFTSIRHALGQLTARHAAERIAESKTWRQLPADPGQGAAGSERRRATG